MKVGTYILKENSLKNQELSLHPLHLEDLKRSGLSDETILRAGIRSVPPAEIKKLLGFEPQKLISAYLIPYPNTRGFFRLRCFYEDGYSGAKYLQRKESGSHLYIPPSLDVSILRNSEIPLYVTEGEKKALKACQEGLPCVAVAGLWNWSDGSGELISDFDHIELKGRTTFLVPDNDWLLPNKHGYSKNLTQAVQRLALKLIERGAEVYLVELPKSQKKIGLDDYLCKHSVDEFLKLPTNQIIKNAESYKKALDILKYGDPLKFIVSELSKEYILRNKELALCYLLTLLPKLNTNAIAIVTGESSVGKSSLVSTVLKAIPDAYKLLLHSSSSKALFYKNKDLSNMNLYINEFSGATEIVELLKGLMTEKQATHFTVNDSRRGRVFQQFSIKAEGFVCFITSTKETFSEELSNRAFIINIRASQEIIDAITKLQAERANGDARDACDYETLIEIYGLIKKLPVEIPFAKEIQKHLDKTKVRITRDFQKVLALIKAHALLNQYQREIKNGKIVAERKDYEAIYEIASLVGESISELREHHMEFLKACEEWITTSDVAKLIGKSERTVKRYIKDLRDYIETDGRGSDLKVKTLLIPESRTLLPSPDVIFLWHNGTNENFLDNSKTYACQMHLAQFGTMAQNDIEAQNVTLCQVMPNAVGTCNSLINKEKMDLCHCATGDYIDGSDIDPDDIEVME